MRSGERNRLLELLETANIKLSSVATNVERAAVAVAHEILLAAFPILADGTVYEDLGDRCLDSLSKVRTRKHLVRRLEALGFRMAIEPTAA